MNNNLVQALQPSACKSPAPSSSSWSSKTPSSTRSNTPATAGSAGGRDLGLAKLAQMQATKSTGKAIKKTPVEKFQETRTAEISRLREKVRMLHEEKMARFEVKKLKYAMANQEAVAQRTAQLELLRLQIQLETVKAQAAVPALLQPLHRPSWDLPMATESELWGDLGPMGGDNTAGRTSLSNALTFRELDKGVSEAGNYSFPGSNKPMTGSFDADNVF